MSTEPEVPGGPQVEIVVPVRNEERDLAPSVRRLVGYLRERFPFTTRVTIADNGSTDRTWRVARELAGSFGEVRVVHLDLPGRGRALHAIWSVSDAAVLAYMDVDLSTDLNALLPLVAPLLSGHSDVAIGTRLARGSRVVRGAKRETISRAYNLLLHATLGVGFSDAQCGFKAIRASAARELLPLVADTSWFFDTELLVLAERAGLRIHEVPVDWIDDADSRVDIVATALGDLRGIRRVGWGLMHGSLQVPQLGAAGPVSSRGLPTQLPRFIAIGVASTVAYLVLYLLLRGFMAAQAANAVALLLTAVGNTAALAVLHPSSRGIEVLVLVAASLAATLLRFVLYRGWVFGERGDGRPASAGDTAGVRGFAAPAAPAGTPAPAAPASSELFMSDVMSDQATGSTR
jgi:putative flippase GtrA